MLKLNLPTYQYRLENRDGKLFIFDPIRKKFIQLTPEEWVRQHFLNLLVNLLGYPASMTSVESGLKYNQKQKRSDILVFANDLKPLALVECKAPHIKLSSNTVEQISTYNKIYGAKMVAISNGMDTYAGICGQTQSEFRMLKEIPSYSMLKQM